MAQKNFAGLDGFVWAVGVVEDRKDPLLLGRCKVRYFGWHQKDKEEIPTKDLPWSTPLQPLDSGNHAVGPKEGDWVLAFFQDGIVAQLPVMMGRIEGYPERYADHKIGFYDARPSSGYCLLDHKVPRDPESWPEHFDDGSGSKHKQRACVHPYPDARFLKEADTTRIERAEKISETIVAFKKESRQKKIVTADHPSSKVGTDSASPGVDWAETPTPYGAKYPYNHVYHSESGHFIEVDDTWKKERIHWYHRAGTFTEIHPDGSTVEKVVNNKQEIVLKNRYTHVENNEALTVDKGMKLFVNVDKEGKNYDVSIGENGNYNLTVYKGNWNINVADGDVNFYTNGDFTHHVTGDYTLEVEKNYNVSVKGDVFWTVKGNWTYLIAKSFARTVGEVVSEVFGSGFNLTVIGMLDFNVTGDQKVSVTGNVRETIGSDYTLHVKGKMKQTIAKMFTLNCYSMIHNVRNIFTQTTRLARITHSWMKASYGVCDQRAREFFFEAYMMPPLARRPSKRQDKLIAIPGDPGDYGAVPPPPEDGTIKFIAEFKWQEHVYVLKECIVTGIKREHVGAVQEDAAFTATCFHDTHDYKHCDYDRVPLVLEVEPRENSLPILEEQADKMNPFGNFLAAYFDALGKSSWTMK